MPYKDVPQGILLEGDMEQDFQLHPGVSLGGVATAASGEAVTLKLFSSGPCEDEMVSLFRDREIMVEAPGAFEFRGLEPGFYWLIASAEGHGTERVHVEAQRSLSAKLIRLRPSVLFAGEVTLSDRSVLSLEQVPLTLTFDGPVAPAFVDG